MPMVIREAKLRDLKKLSNGQMTKMSLEIL